MIGKLWQTDADDVSYLNCLCVSVAALGATLITHALGTKLATSRSDSVFYGR